MEPLIKATLRETREHNERLVLATIYDDGPASRAEVARLTGLTRTTVSDVVEGLLGEGLAREIGRGPSTGGKAPILLEVPDTARQTAWSSSAIPERRQRLSRLPARGAHAGFPSSP